MVLPASLREYLRAPVSKEQVESFRLGPWPLPESARSFYARSDGFAVPELETEVLSLAGARKYAEAISQHPLARYFGLLPITDSDDSNPYCLILGPRLNGAILLLSHEGEVRITHRSLQGFLESLASALEEDAELIDDLKPEEITDPGMVAEADELIRELLDQRPPDWDGLLFPLIAACSPKVLISLLQADDMWIREEAAIRCGTLRLAEARESLEQLARSGNGQDARAAKASLSRINRRG